MRRLLGEALVFSRRETAQRLAQTQGSGEWCDASLHTGTEAARSPAQQAGALSRDRTVFSAQLSTRGRAGSSPASTSRTSRAGAKAGRAAEHLQKWAWLLQRQLLRCVQLQSRCRQATAPFPDPQQRPSALLAPRLCLTGLVPRCHSLSVPGEDPARRPPRRPLLDWAPRVAPSARAKGPWRRRPGASLLRLSLPRIAEGAHWGSGARSRRSARGAVHFAKPSEPSRRCWRLFTREAATCEPKGREPGGGSVRAARRRHLPDAFLCRRFQMLKGQRHWSNFRVCTALKLLAT
uniref:Uncharacterized protein n=1 Tax=Sphaerodactylus townsendi TaxID=933632 RepID=A0ACB8GAC5_9SAUR